MLKKVRSVFGNEKYIENIKIKYEKIIPFLKILGILIYGLVPVIILIFVVFIVIESLYPSFDSFFLIHGLSIIFFSVGLLIFFMNRKIIIFILKILWSLIFSAITSFVFATITYFLLDYKYKYSDQYYLQSDEILALFFLLSYFFICFVIYFKIIIKNPRLLLIIFPLVAILGLGININGCGSGCLPNGFYGFYLDFGLLGPTYQPDFTIPTDAICPAICTVQMWYQLKVDLLLLYFLYLFFLFKNKKFFFKK